MITTPHGLENCTKEEADRVRSEFCVKRKKGESACADCRHKYMHQGMFRKRGRLWAYGDDSCGHPDIKEVSGGGASRFKFRRDSWNGTCQRFEEREVRE